MKFLQIILFIYFISIIIGSIAIILESIPGGSKSFILLFNGFIIILLLNARDIFKEKNINTEINKYRVQISCYTVNTIFIAFSLYLYSLKGIYAKFPGILNPSFFLISGILSNICVTIQIVYFKKHKLNLNNNI
jgi:hypothetical protein